MPVEICARITKPVNSTVCPTPGGTNRNSWVFQKEQFTTAETFSTVTGALSSFGLVTGEKGIKAIGRPKLGSGASASTTNVNGSTEVAQTLVQVFGFKDQLALNAIEEFLSGGSKVVFQELANGKIRIFFKEYGNETSKGEETTGTALTDTNGAMTATLEGNEPRFPLYFEAPIAAVTAPAVALTQLASSRAFLDNLVTLPV